MKDIFAEFAQLLRKRFEQGVYTTEDSIRYTFFAALLAKSDLEAQDVVLEYPHPQIPGAKVDTLLTSDRGAALLHESNVARNDPDPVVGHRLIAYDAGLPKFLIRFSTLHARTASAPLPC